MEFKADSSVRRVKTNGFFSAIHFAVFALMSVFFIPFLRNQYGDGTYGLIALAGFLTQYIGLIAGCIGSSIGRFLNVALNKNDWEDATEIFSTALVGNLILVLIQIPFFAWGIWKLDVLIDFPPEQATDFRILVVCSVVTFLVSMLVSALGAPIQAANRLDISRKTAIFFEIARLGTLVGMIKIFGPRLWIIGVVDVGLVLLGSCASFYFCRKLTPNLVFKWKNVSLKWLKPVMKMAGWSVIAGFGARLFLKTDVWIINRFVDVKLAGVCAVLLILPNFLQQIAKTGSSLLQPVVMIDYAQGRHGRIRDVVLLGTKVFSHLAMVCCGGVMILGPWVLATWMDESYRQYQGYLVLMFLHFPITLGREAIWVVFPAYNKMEYVGISNLVCGIINLALSIGFVFMGFSITGVIVATGISLILQRTLFLSYYASKLIDVSYGQFLRIYIPGFILILAVGFQMVFFKDSSLMTLGILCLISGAFSFGWMYAHDTKVKDLVGAIFSARRAR